MGNIWLHRYTLLVAVATLLLVVAGAAVTSNEAGLSVPDWPLSYGKLMPQMTGGVRFEHSHRVVATTVGFLTVVLALWLLRAEPRRWMRMLGLVAVAAVIVQGVLGGLTVLFLLPKPVSILHACLAQLFFSTTVAMAVFTSPGWQRGPEPLADCGWPSMRSLSVATPLAVLAQLALGAAFRHRASGLIPHAVGAMLVTGVILLFSILVLTQYPTHRALRQSAIWLMMITFVQVFLGIAAYMSRLSFPGGAPPELVTVLFTVTHVATGALTLAASVVLSIHVLRNVRSGVAAEASQRGVAVHS